MTWIDVVRLVESTVRPAPRRQSLSNPKETVGRIKLRFAAQPTLASLSHRILILFFLAQLLVYTGVFVPLNGDRVFWDKHVGLFKPLAFAASEAALFALFSLLPPQNNLRTSSISINRIALLAVVLTMLVGFVALQSFQNSGDEYAYNFQALTYITGHLTNAPPPLGPAMSTAYVWVTPTKWAGQYSPGWPLMMLPSIFAGFPGWTANLPALLISAWFLYGMVRREVGQELAITATAVFLLSPFTIFTAASFFPHMACAVLVLAAMSSATYLRQARSAIWALSLGVSIGILGLTRSLDAALVSLLIAVTLSRSRQFWTKEVWIIAAGGLPFLVVLLWYQWKLTGNPLTPSYYLGTRREDHLYFDGPSILLGLFHTTDRISALLIWISPPVVALWIAALGVKAYYRQVAPMDLLLPLAMAVLVFYPLDGGNGYGPRYYFEFWSGICFITATAAPFCKQRVNVFGIRIYQLTVIYGLVAIPFLATDYHGLISERRDLYDQAAKLPVKAVICVRSSSGLRSPLLLMDLARNGTAANGAVLFAWCIPGMPASIRSTFPNRQLWYYDRGELDRYGRLSRG